MKEHMNYTLLCDFYELTMGNGYFQTEGYADQICYFDVFFRNVPDGGGFAIAAGLEQVIDYIENLPSSPSAPPPLRPSSSRPSCCSPSTTSPSSPPRPTASSGPPTAAR